jgi:hypothetical protein
MKLRVAESFEKSLATLDGPGRAAAKRAAFDFIAHPAGPGLRMHRLVHAEDRRFWSIRVNRDLRIIVYRCPDVVVLCYAAHHDDAYAWAGERRLSGLPGAHPDQDVEIDSSSRRAEPPNELANAMATTEPKLVPMGRRFGAASSRRSSRRLRVWKHAVAPLPGRLPPSVPTSDPPPLVQLLRSFLSAHPSPPKEHSAPVAGEAEPRPGCRRGGRPCVRGNRGRAGSGDGGRRLAEERGLAIPFAVASIQGLLAALLGITVWWFYRASRLQAQAELTCLVSRLQSGHLGARADPKAVGAALRPLVERVNWALDAATEPADTAIAAWARLSRSGRPKVSVDRERLASDLHEAIASMERFLTLRANQIQDLAGAVHARCPDGYVGTDTTRGNGQGSERGA